MFTGPTFSKSLGVDVLVKADVGGLVCLFRPTAATARMNKAAIRRIIGDSYTGLRVRDTVAFLAQATPQFV